MNQMNEWIRTFSQKFNDILTSGYSGNGDPGVKMFTGNKATGGESSCWMTLQSDMTSRKKGQQNDGKGQR